MTLYSFKGEYYNQEQIKIFLAEQNIDEWENFSSDDPDLDKIEGATVYELEDCIIVAPDDWA